MSLIDRSFSIVLVALTLSLVCFGQTSLLKDHDNQLFNDVQLTVHVSKKVDLLLTTTYRFGKNVSRFNEGRIGSAIVLKPNAHFSTAAGYTFIEARNSAGHFGTEHRYHISGTYKTAFKSIGISHRSQYEYRVRSSGHSWRYRPLISFERSLPETFLSKSKIFLTDEPFYDSKTGRFSRNRVSVGLRKAFNHHFTMDIYYLRQNDGVTVPGDLHVLGTSWKFSL